MLQSGFRVWALYEPVSRREVRLGRRKCLCRYNASLINSLDAMYMSSCPVNSQIVTPRSEEKGDGE